MSAARAGIVIVGGGMVGASLACALAQVPGEPLEVTLVERFPLALDAAAAPKQPGFDARCTALSLSSVAFFESIGVWAGVRAHAAPIRRIHVSDRGRFGATRMDAGEEALPALGYVIENHWLGRALHAALRDCRGLTVRAPAQVGALEPRAGGMRVQFDGAEPAIDCTLAVIADGARSALAARLGIGSESQDYGQRAVIANVSHREPHAGRAFERFTADGPLAMLPLPDAEGRSRSAVVWVMPPAQAAEVLALDDTAFLQRLQARFGYRLGRLLRAGARSDYPLTLTRATEQVRSGVVLLGNAAHALHPVAGQGFNLSVRDVACLAGVLLAAREEGESIGALAVLRRFADAQQQDQFHTIGFSDALPRIFTSGLLPLVLARDAGLVGLELIPAARGWLARRATGL